MEFDFSELFTRLGDLYTGWVFLPLLVGALLFFTGYLGVPQWYHGRKAFGILFSTQKKQSNATKNGASLFQTLATSLAGSIGMGSVTGVSMALVIGGPGTLFWMWVLAVLGMSLRLAEVTFAHHTRKPLPAQAGYEGGPMHYMQRVLKWPWVAKLYAFAILVAAFIAANFTQSNSVAKLLEGAEGSHATQLDKWVAFPTYLTGLVFALLVALVILGGLRRIAQLAEYMIPFMSIVYFVLVCVILSYNYTHILPALRLIFVEAFRGKAVLGVSVGAAIWITFSQGMRFGFFATEMISGTSGIVHSAGKETNSLRVGRLSMLEPIFTLFLCCLTGLVLLCSGGGTYWKEGYMKPIDPDYVKVVDGNQNPYTGDLLVEDGLLKAADQQVIFNNSLVTKFVLQQTNGVEERDFSIKVVAGKIVQSADGALLGETTLAGVALARSVFKVHKKKTPRLNLICMILLIICLLLFAFSTVISWAYYGEQALRFLGWGRFVFVYKLFYIAAVVLSSTMEAAFVWDLASVSFVCAALPNIIAVFSARKEIKKIIKKLDK